MDYNEYRDKWNNYPRNFVQEKVPIHLDLEITTKCGLNCIMCARNVEHTKPMDMDLDLAKKIIKEFAEKGGCAIKFCYLGEPLLYPHLIELIRYSKEKGIIDTRLATSGNILSEKQARGLIEAGLDLIIFSVDSMFPEIYKKIRVGGDLNKVLINIRTFKLIRDNLGLTKPIIQIQAIPFEVNKGELDSKLYHDYYKQFADLVWESPWCKDYTKDLVVKGDTANFFCDAPFRRFLVRVNGDIWLCCGDPLKEKYIGTFPNMSIEEAWNGGYIKNVRNHLNKGEAHLIPACKKCSERYYKQ